MSNTVLAIYYTQTGQLAEIVDNFTKPFIEAGIEVEKVSIKPAVDYEFPWTSDRFFDKMPESVLGIPTELAPFTLRETSYALIIFAYQPWFLSPSLPATSLLANPAFRAILKNTPVVTLIGARNMWLNSQDKMKKILSANGARLVGNVALTDRHSNLVSAVTILYWMLTGKKDRYLNKFPKPGIADDDIKNSSIFGNTVKQHLQNGNWNGMQETLVRQKAVVVEDDLMFIEARARRLFSIWAKVIIKKKNRLPWVKFFKYYLLIALFVVAPLVLTVNRILFKPFALKRIKQKKQYYSGLN